jgi:hypothetical protein
VHGVSARSPGADETKAAFKATEFIAYVATVAAVLIASAIDDGIDGRLAWILVTALTVGYMLSRGVASPAAVTARETRRSNRHCLRIGGLLSTSPLPVQNPDV